MHVTVFTIQLYWQSRHHVMEWWLILRSCKYNQSSLGRQDKDIVITLIQIRQYVDSFMSFDFRCSPSHYTHTLTNSLNPATNTTQPTADRAMTNRATCIQDEDTYWLWKHQCTIISKGNILCGSEDRICNHNYSYLSCILHCRNMHPHLPCTHDI